MTNIIILRVCLPRGSLCWQAKVFELFSHGKRLCCHVDEDVWRWRWLHQTRPYGVWRSPHQLFLCEGKGKRKCLRLWMITPGIFWIDNIIYAEPFLSTSFYLEELEGGGYFFLSIFSYHQHLSSAKKIAACRVKSWQNRNTQINKFAR